MLSGHHIAWYGDALHPRPGSGLFKGHTVKWFRVWTDVRDDVKMLQLSDYEFRMWIYLLSYASDVNALSGHFQITFKLLSLHFHQRFNLFSRAIETFQRLGLIAVDKDDYITITNWNKRQFKSDDNYSRVIKHRALTSKRNVSETELKRPQITDTDTDTDNTNNNTKKTKIILRENHFTEIPEMIISKWKEVAPGIDINSEIRKAELWIMSNPEKKRSRWESFLSNWMVRAQKDFIKYGGNGNGRANSNFGYEKRQPRSVQAQSEQLNEELAEITSRWAAQKAASVKTESNAE